MPQEGSLPQLATANSDRFVRKETQIRVRGIPAARRNIPVQDDRIPVVRARVHQNSGCKV